MAVELTLLSRTELEILEVLWSEGDLTASQLAVHFNRMTGWNHNTTYTVIKKCVEKNFIQRTEPKFQCRALVTREQVQQYALQRITDMLYGGDPRLFLKDARQKAGTLEKRAAPRRRSSKK